MQEFVIKQALFPMLVEFGLGIGGFAFAHLHEHEDGERRTVVGGGVDASVFRQRSSR